MTPTTRYIPANSEPRTSDTAPGAIVYYYTDRRNYLCAIAYHGKVNKHDYHAAYVDPARRDKDAAQYFADQAERRALMAKRHAERKLPHAIKIGNIFHWSWGYDQTNAEFYQVVAVTPGTVTVRRVASKPHGDCGDMSGHVVAERDRFIEPPIVKRPGISRGEAFLPMPYGWCSIWDGTPVYTSSYA